MAVDVAGDGAVALAKARSVPYDVVVLDRHLPVLHGDEVCRRLVAEGAEARILMLTAADSTDQLVDGLDLGADDYLVKPVVLDELGARLRALARRNARPARPPTARPRAHPRPGLVSAAGAPANPPPRCFRLAGPPPRGGGWGAHPRLPPAPLRGRAFGAVRQHRPRDPGGAAPQAGRAAV